MTVNDSWRDALKELTPKALESGIARLKALSAGNEFTKYPPKCLEFKALCLAFYEDLRLPSTIDAYREIRAKLYSTQLNFSHPVIKFTAGKLDVDFLKLNDDARTFAIFKRAYEQVCLLVKQGHELPPMRDKPMVVTSQSKVIGEAHLAKMKRLLGA